MGIKVNVQGDIKLHLTSIVIDKMRADGLSQAQVAKMANVGESRIHYLVNGQQNKLTVEAILHIMVVIGIQAHFIVEK